MGRPTKLDAKLQKAIVVGLKTGATINDVCSSVGIGKATYYQWLEIGEAALAGEPHPRMPEGEAEQKLFADFADAVTRAQSDAKHAAIKTLRAAMNPYTETHKFTKSFKETRLKRDGTAYEYKREEASKTTIRRQGDWRAALEYLKRRHYDEWGDRSKLDLDPDAAIIAAIRAGEVTYEALSEEFGREEATRLYRAAGETPQAGAGESEESADSAGE